MALKQVGHLFKIKISFPGTKWGINKKKNKLSTAKDIGISQKFHNECIPKSKDIGKKTK